MISIKEAQQNELNIIQDIAYKTWPVTYAGIVSNTQLDYMLNKFYSLEGLNENLNHNHHFLIARDDENPVGFASYLHHYQNNPVTRIPKIYILPEAQGKGVGKLLIDTISKLAITEHAEKLTLNVNRQNIAREFYLKIGFEIVAEENIPLERGYLMEDYIMERHLP